MYAAQVLGIYLTVAAALPSDLPSIAILDIDVQRGIVRDTGVVFGELLQHDLRRRGHRVISQADINSLLTIDKMQQALDCEGQGACLAELGGALGVDELLTCRISIARPNLVVTLRRLSIAKAEVVGQAAARTALATGALLDALPGLVTELYGPPSFDAQLDASGHASSGGPSLAGPIGLLSASAIGTGLGAWFWYTGDRHADKASDPDYVGRQVEIERAARYRTYTYTAFALAGASALAGTLWWALAAPAGEPAAVSGATPGPAVAPVVGRWVGVRVTF